MQIRLLRNLGRGYPPLRVGEVAEVDDEMANKLVSHGLAEIVVQAVPKQAVKAVPVEPIHGTTEKAEADLGTYKERQKKKNDE